MATDIIVSEMTSATQINTNDLMIMTQPDLLAETGYSTKKGTVLQVANKMLKGTEYLTDLPDFTDKTVLGGLEELKGDLTALLPVNTASGSIANFDTDLSLPLVDCKANIVATGGNGTPSTPIPINGYTSCTISVADENMSVQDTHTVSWQTEAGTVYGGNLDLTTGVLTVTHLRKTSFTRGALDTSGKLYKVADLTDGSEWLDTYNAPPLMCNMFLIVGLGDARTLNSGQLTQYGKVIYISGYVGNENALDALLPTLEVVYPLATPVTYQLTPVQVQALLGVNNVFNDTNGDTEVKYKDGIQHYVDKKIAATQALIL